MSCKHCKGYGFYEDHNELTQRCMQCNPPKGGFNMLFLGDPEDMLIDNLGDLAAGLAKGCLDVAEMLDEWEMSGKYDFD